MGYTKFNEIVEAVEIGSEVTVFFSTGYGEKINVSGKIIVIDCDLEVGIVEVETSEQEVYTIEESGEIIKSEKSDKTTRSGTLRRVEL
jgi:hypothetical protein